METLTARIDRAGPLEQSEAVILAARLARALEGPHARGEAHGAVNPESVLVERDDLSSAILRASSRSNASFHHQCPERLAGGSPTTEDDVWAVGSTLYLALTGTVPFPGDSPAEVGARIELGSIAPLAVFDAGDDDLQELLEGIFHPKLSERTRTSERVRRSLTRWLAKRGIAPRPALKIGSADAAPVDLSTIPPPPRLPEMEDRPTIPRVQQASGVLYTFADEDTTLPKDTGPHSYAPPSSSRNQDAPLSSRLPPTSELLARAKAAQPSKTPPPGPTGQLKPAELANRLRSPSVPPSGPRLNPPKVARDRAAKALSDPPPSGKPSSLRPFPPPPRLPSDQAPTSSPQSSAAELREPATMLSPRPSPMPSTMPSPLPVESKTSSERPASGAKKPSTRPPPLPVGPSSKPPPLPVEPSDASKAKRQKTALKAKKAVPAAPPAPEVPAAPSVSPKSSLGKMLIAAAVVVAGGVGYVLSSGGGGAPTTPDGPAQASSPVLALSAAPGSATAAAMPTSKPAPTGPSPDASAVVVSSAPASSAPVGSSSVVPSPVGDVGACLVNLFPEDSFAEGAHPKLEVVCRENDPRKGAQKVHEALVIAGMGRTVSDGMREWAVMGWYELAAFAAVRGRCCPDPTPLELPPSPGTCNSMQDALNAVAKAARPGAKEPEQQDSLNAFRKSLSCMLKSGKSKPFGSYPKPAGGEDTAFMKTVERTRAH